MSTKDKYRNVYSIKNDQPQLKDGEEDVYIIPITINVSTNQNYANLVAEFSNTIKSLSLTDTEIEEYENSKIPFYCNYYLQKYRTYANMSDFPLDMHVALRNDITNLKDSTGIMTNNNEFVRSKSEKILADLFSSQGIVYIYECPLV